MHASGISNIGNQEVAIQMFRLATKTRKEVMEAARIHSAIHKTGQRVT